MLKKVKIVEKRKKRLGRGYGSGKGGHTSSRGQKGQKTRGKIGIIFEGVKVKKSFIKRLPVLRGKGKLKPLIKPIAIKVSSLNVFPENSVVDEKLLIEKGIVKKSDAKKRGIKIVGGGKLEKKLVVKLPTTASVLKQIEALAKK
ncbi:MAG: LSU ribosomal protein L15p (L27Ae) [Candidatus Woesebacteria bacterium]|nr:MAG: LSU ribosomal protein L15p (L27Ae) [Candidatus Woesebacteria bacterium]